MCFERKHSKTNVSGRSRRDNFCVDLLFEQTTYRVMCLSRVALDFLVYKTLLFWAKKNLQVCNEATVPLRPRGRFKDIKLAVFCCFFITTYCNRLSIRRTLPGNVAIRQPLGLCLYIA